MASLLLVGSSPSMDIVLPKIANQDTFGWGDFPLLSSSSDGNAAIERFVSGQRKRLIQHENRQPTLGKEHTIVKRDRVTDKEQVARRERLPSKIKFHTVCIREYGLTVGDHEWCDDGLSLSLDWSHTTARNYAIDEYEVRRFKEGRTQRGYVPRVSYHQRRKMLQEVSGFTEEELIILEREAAGDACFSQGVNANPLKRSTTEGAFFHLGDMLANPRDKHRLFE